MFLSMGVNQRSTKHSVWLNPLLLVALGVAVVCLGFLYRLSQISGEIGQQSNTAVMSQTSEVLIERLPVTTQDTSAPSISIETVPARVEKADEQHPYARRLSELRTQYRYPMNMNDNVDEQGRSPEVRFPQMYEQFTQWFYEDPDLFIELLKTQRSDFYLAHTLKLVINESNVSLLSKHLHVRELEIISVAYENKLHIQNPEPFLEIFDQFAGNNIIEYSTDILNAAADIDYWGRRDVFIEQAINNPTPQKYFETLERKGHEDLHQLAEQMWLVHSADDYPTNLTNRASYIERIRVAYAYGVDESKKAIGTLLQDGIRVSDTINNYTDVKNASENFTEIRASLIYNPKTMLWVNP
jgi:hypothetical protein